MVCLQFATGNCTLNECKIPRHVVDFARRHAAMLAVRFRGEALCSISFVSHMTVTTMARGAEYGFRATFKVRPHRHYVRVAFVQPIRRGCRVLPWQGVRCVVPWPVAP